MTRALTPWPDAPASTEAFEPKRYARADAGSTNLEPDPGLLLDEADLTKTIDRLLKSSGADDDRDWSVAIRLLAAHLHGLTFDEVSTVIGMKPASVRKILHGDQTLQGSKHDQIGRMLVVTTKLRRLLSAESIGAWFRTPVPALKNDTPLETVRTRHLEKVERLVDSYFDPSYA